MNATDTIRPAGVEIAGTGTALPDRELTNADLEKLMDTSDEWITQRTGIRARRIVTPENGENTTALATRALAAALQDAGLEGSELDLVVCATMTPDMPTPGVSAVAAHRVGATGAGAFDLSAACSGFVFSLNTAHALIAGGRYRNVAVIGADILSRFMEYTTRGRSTAVLFGDAGAAMILRASDDPHKNLIAQAMHADGGGAQHLYIPTFERDAQAYGDDTGLPMSQLRMHGPAVFRFAVGKFPQLIADTLERADLAPEDIDHFVCHQSNQRILESARERFGIPHEKLRVNINKYGNTVAASVPLVFHELRTEGRIKPGQLVMFLGFGAGLTWGSSLWRV